MDFNNTYRKKADLSPAKWIWYPSVRTLSNTFAFFRKEFILDEDTISATGYIAADSRYILYINGQRVQWGPAPSDPRYMEVDPMDVAGYLKKGKNVIGVHVLYYGFGEGTWVCGTPGLLFKLNVKLSDGTEREIISDKDCLCAIDWSHEPGNFQRWYLRSLQEICDGRKLIKNWNLVDFTPDDSWMPAMEIGEGNIPSICTSYYDYANDGYFVTATDTSLVKREIPMLNEIMCGAERLAEAGTIHWKKPKDYWFLFRQPDVFSADLGLDIKNSGDDISFSLPKDKNTSCFLTFEFKEQIVGFPYFEISAPEGTTVEIITQEGHALGQNLLLDTNVYCWSRYICSGGSERFETFDFESCKWLQLNIYNPDGGKVTVKNVGIRRRMHPFKEHRFSADDKTIQKVYNAGINTVYNAALETIVDGMGRERQQYSGDLGHVLIALRYIFGDTLLNERYIQTYSTGMTKEGLFFDSWPGTDRIKRLSQKQIGLTMWGNIVDHSIQFVFDCYKYYLSSGNLECLRSPMKAIDRLIAFLKNTCGNSLYPTDDRNSGCIWLDHNAYSVFDPKTKECAINIYIAGMIENAYIPLCKAFGYDEKYIEEISSFAKNLVKMITDKYWCPVDKTFYDNLPYAKSRDELFVADRTLAMAILYGYCKEGDTKKSVELLKGDNKALRLSYPCNSVWRMWGLLKGGELETYVKELSDIWGKLPSVNQNNTYQEYWDALPDGMSEWSHIPCAPLLCIYEGVLGLSCNNIKGNHLEISPRLTGFCSFNTRVYNNGDIFEIEVVKKSERVFELKIDSDKNGKYTLTPAPGCSVNRLSENRYKLTYAAR